MPVAAFTPSRLHTDYAEWTAPGIAYNGQVWAWNNTTGKYEPTALAFDPAGTAAAAISTHLAAGNPHTQYALSSALGTAAYLNVGTSANNIVQLNGSGQLPAVDGSLLTGISGGSGSPGGSTTQVQYNNAGSFAGDAGMTYNASTDRLTVAGGLVAPSVRPSSDGTTAIMLLNAAGSNGAVFDSTNIRWGVGIVPRHALDIYGSVAGSFASSTENTNNSGYAQMRVSAGSNAAALAAYGSSFGGVGVYVANSVSFGSAAVGGFVITNEHASGFISFVTAGFATTNERMRVTSTGVAIGQSSNTALLDIAASTTTSASLRIRHGTAPTSPNDGDIWQDGSHIYCRIGGVTKQLDN